MWTYSSNFMGPASTRWYEENNIPYVEVEYKTELFKHQGTYKHYKQYAGGRIDCRCDNPSDENYDRYGYELNLPIMEVESFNMLSDWLHTYTSDTLDFNVLSTFENTTKHKLKIFKENKGE